LALVFFFNPVHVLQSQIRPAAVNRMSAENISQKALFASSLTRPCKMPGLWGTLMAPWSGPAATGCHSITLI